MFLFYSKSAQSLSESLGDLDEDFERQLQHQFNQREVRLGVSRCVFSATILLVCRL